MTKVKVSFGCGCRETQPKKETSSDTCPMEKKSTSTQDNKNQSTKKEDVSKK